MSDEKSDGCEWFMRIMSYYVVAFWGISFIWLGFQILSVMIAFNECDFFSPCLAGFCSILDALEVLRHLHLWSLASSSHMELKVDVDMESFVSSATRQLKNRFS